MEITDINKIAHITKLNVQLIDEQIIKEHFENVAIKALDFYKYYKIKSLDVKDYAYQAGLAHDIGKYSDLFQKKIRGSYEIKTDHSTAGAKEMHHSLYGSAD